MFEDGGIDLKKWMLSFSDGRPSVATVRGLLKQMVRVPLAFHWHCVCSLFQQS